MDFEHSKGNLFDSLLGKSFEVYSQPDQEAEVAYIAPLEEIEQEGIPLFEEEDRDILMHRDAHFSKNFLIMTEYYAKESKGATADVSYSRIDELMKLEQKLGRDLAPLVLQGADAERVAKARALYRALQKQYENPAAPLELHSMIDLIFSEEEDPTIDAAKAASFGEKMIPYLVSLIKTEELYDPLFPGYGKAPIAAALALGMLKAESAIEPLFLMLTKHDFDVENAALTALAAIGDKAKQFCLKLLMSRPLTQDNERAAIAISAFAFDEPVGQAILALLRDKEVQKKEPLVTYLIIACENLPQHLWPVFKEIATTATLPERAREEMMIILRTYR
jgi:hypothetical protein